MVTQAHTTTKVNAKVEQIRLNSPTRLLIYGSARKASDNSAFMYASKNVAADYKKDLPIKSYFLQQGANELIEIIASQPDNSIQSLDIFCHGSPDGIYFILGASMTETFTEKEVRSKNLPSNLYRSMFVMVNMWSPIGSNNFTNQHRISNLKLSAFTNESKIEIHGCSTASTKSGDDNFCSALSKELYNAGKKRSVVIGHATKANPNIGGTTEIKKQDYRHGTRAIYNNSKLLTTVKTDGRISANVIRSALGGE
ncbi:hypothetical protein [Acinetobacter dispersus]|uniref:Uncharacterized protein n=1 Tax=Acinetobacter dispersus TaxID=70348 RepID=N9MPP1_9GAMM|nr:hypothetical protein [Acinetobacter dispersus]ENW92731.1 hypothetical protein F904_02674 [Acinetobacter dispersus]